MPVGNGEPLKSPKQGSNRTRFAFRNVKGRCQQWGRVRGRDLDAYGLGKLGDY